MLDELLHLVLVDIVVGIVPAIGIAGVSPYL